MTRPASDLAQGRGRGFRAALWLHRWTSLLAAVPFLILCLTGAVLIFHHEIDDAMGLAPKAVSATDRPPLALDRLRAIAQEKVPGLRPQGFNEDASEHPGVVGVFFVPPGEKGFEHTKSFSLDRRSGQVLELPERRETLTGFLLELHAQWFLGLPGQLLGALIAALVVVSLVSGLFVYGPYVRKVAFGLIRGRTRGPSGRRLAQLDWHNFIGVVVLGWALVVGVTGLALGVGPVAVGVWQQAALAELAVRHAPPPGTPPLDPARPPAGPDAAWTAAAAAQPGWRPALLFYPDTDYSPPAHYTVLLQGPHGLDERLYRVALVDARTGRLAETLELPWFVKGIQLSQPLHFGDYGGLPLKMLWVVASFLTLFITGNGAWLWWARRRQHRAKPPGRVSAPDRAPPPYPVPAPALAATSTSIPSAGLAARETTP